MEFRISATELARGLGDILGRIRYRGEVFTVERNGSPVAVIGPVRDARPGSLTDAMKAWLGGDRDPSFADDLERVSRADLPPG
ncbi:MAG TPA: hypothetical protein VMM77_04000, partial [Gemmatimonadaceae bacterium]|nr:hypothetical protein [Gemmatimonadaceae bacterium]